MKIVKILSFFLFLFLVIFCANDSDYSEVVVNTSFEKKVSFVETQKDDVVKANVIIYNNNHSSFLGLTYKKNNTYGSGFVFYEDNEYYYILTNNHVVSDESSYMYNELVVEDYYGNKYDASILKSSLSYDLAVIRIDKSAELYVLNISEDNESIRNSVRAIGNPNEIKNIVSDGKINCYSRVNVKSDKSQVDFEVIVHTAPISGGSSGGALLNEENEVVGVTFAGVFDNKNNFITAYAIPASKINDFLN